MNLPSIVTTHAMHLSELTRRECELVAMRANRGWLTAEERYELNLIQRAQQLRQESAAAQAEHHAEGRIFHHQHTNPHGD